MSALTHWVTPAFVSAMQLTSWTALVQSSRQDARRGVSSCPRARGFNCDGEPSLYSKVYEGLHVNEWACVPDIGSSTTFVCASFVPPARSQANDAAPSDSPVTADFLELPPTVLAALDGMMVRNELPDSGAGSVLFQWQVTFGPGGTAWQTLASNADTKYLLGTWSGAEALVDPSCPSNNSYGGVYTNGLYCAAVGGDRQATVRWTCGGTNTITAVREVRASHRCL
jgi:hypothetical protein